MANREHLIVPDFTKRYISLIKETDVNKAIRKNTKVFNRILQDIPKKKIDYAYAVGKWTIKEVLQHVIDAERVFTFRALWFARKDISPLPGFDENTWAHHARVSTRNWKEMIEEFNIVRKGTQLLFASFGEEELKATGTANNTQINVAALGYLCAGHNAHHINILTDRYLSKKRIR